MQGNVEDMPFPFEIGGKPPDHGMLFGKQHAVAGLRKTVGGRQTTQPAAGYDDVKCSVHLSFL